jgi:hypothetical protein
MKLSIPISPIAALNDSSPPSTETAPARLMEAEGRLQAARVFKPAWSPIRPFCLRGQSLPAPSYLVAPYSAELTLTVSGKLFPVEPLPL